MSGLIHGAEDFSGVEEVEEAADDDDGDFNEEEEIVTSQGDSDQACWVLDGRSVYVVPISSSRSVPSYTGMVPSFL